MGSTPPAGHFAKVLLEIWERLELKNDGAQNPNAVCFYGFKVMTHPRILLIEDEKSIIELIKFTLEQEGFNLSVCRDGSEALDAALTHPPDLVLLDLMLPGVDGIEICKILRRNPKTADIPVIILSAKGEESDRVLGLELGADDYIAKPFSPRELVARIRAVLRRGRKPSQKNSVRIGDFTADFAKHAVSLKGEPVVLTSKEYDLLKILLQSDGCVLTRKTLLEKVWGYGDGENIETRTVDMHIGQLRKKIKSAAKHIITIKNVGYRFDFEA